MILESHEGALRAVAAPMDGVQVWVSGHATAQTSHQADDQATLQVSSRTGRRVSIIIKVALGAAVGYWHPRAGIERTLVPDWAGGGAVSAIDSAPMGVLYDLLGDVVFWFASDSLVTVTNLAWGVAEEDGTFTLAIDGAIGSGASVTVRLGRGGHLATVVGEVAEWMQGLVGRRPLPVPPQARRPVYSTWYAYHEAVDQRALQTESHEAAELGFGSVFLDFGWQLHGDSRYFDGCGDWYRDPAVFPDLADSVRRLRERNLDCVLWVAPLMLGARSAASAAWERFAPHYSESLRVRILDPRHREVREHIVQTCVRLMRDYGLAGLKIDFVDIAMAYANTPSAGDIDDVGAAMVEVFAQLTEAFRVNGWEKAYVEFRQPYVSPAMAPFGNIVRAGDCPGDAIANRTSIVDARMFATDQAIHSDMVMWAADATPQAVAWQLFNTFFAVPQVSTRLAELAPGQRSVLRSFLRLWNVWGDVAARGMVTAPGSHSRYPVVRADGTDARTVIVMYEPAPIILTGTENRVLLVNASGGRVAISRERGPAQTMRISTWDMFGTETANVTLTLSSAFVEIPIPSCGWAEISMEAESYRLTGSDD